MHSRLLCCTQSGAISKGGGLEKDVRITVVYTSSVKYSYCEAKLPYNDTGTEV